VSSDRVLIIGAGPYGLSLSAHLRGRRIDHRVVGRPADNWRAHMPKGMNLKSEPYGSYFSAPSAGYDLATYCRSHGLDYVDRLGPLPLERFLGYADWFASQLVPGIDDVTVTGIAAADNGFRVTFEDADPVTAQQVVVATGVRPFANVPAELQGLPADLVSHTSDHCDLEPFRGRRVAVIGAGQSAIETAALLHESGADTQLVVRGSAVHFIDPNPEQISGLGHIKRPVTKLCEGWHCAFWNSPFAFRRLPEDMRITKARTVLGPNGSWWLKDRVDGVVEVLVGHRVKGAVSAGSGVQLLLDGPKRSTIDVDHVIAGTGYRVDMAALTYLAPDIKSRLRTAGGYPVLSRSCESSVPGLYFMGAPAAGSLGPSMRFIAGTHNCTPQVARSLARR
jgi:FAD-dependent urate hydroxylase